MRTIIDLPDDQLEALDNYRREIGISRAEAIRRAVASFLPLSTSKPGRLRDHPAFGSSNELRETDSVTWVQKLRSEWD